MQNNIAEIKIRAERRAGELLGDMRDSGQLPAHRTNKEVSQNVTLPELGITRNQSSRWQSIAGLPQEEFDTHIEETKEKGAEFASWLATLVHSNSLSYVCAMDTYNSDFTPNTQLSPDEIRQMIEHMEY